MERYRKASQFTRIEPLNTIINHLEIAKMKNFLVVLLFIVASCSHKAKQNNISTQNKSFEIREKVETFGFGYKLGQTVYITEEDYKVILNSKNPQVIFIYLCEKDNIQDKLYAFCALYKVDRNIFYDFYKRLYKKETEIIQFGCHDGEISVESVLIDSTNTNHIYGPNLFKTF